MRVSAGADVLTDRVEILQKYQRQAVSRLCPGSGVATLCASERLSNGAAE